MHASDVSQAFAFVERQYSGTPCRECKGRRTVGVVCQSVVSVSCEDCGGATRIGTLAALWTPQSGAPGPRPVLRAPRETSARGRAGRQRPL
ncbi:hypothetical protein [Streptomyces sp. bgisy153]|uniref:hypothetical protein n=1 Tax=Streptomyces sp. bgisy153 TaxID=3413793 RepID=UPI003D75BAA1